jgi:septal ring-binding cell division protein DamX
MKNLIFTLIISGLVLSLMSACGPDEEELRLQAEAEEQARQDSLERVREAEMEQLRQDSIEQARRDSIALAEQQAEEEAREREEAMRVQFSEEGVFTVQVRSWRSEDKAEEHAQKWRDRGFDHVYIEQFGNAEVGDVWFRVRMGNVSTHEMAKLLQEQIKEEYDADSWVGSVVRN